MKIRSDSYELTKIGENYDLVAEALRTEAMLHSAVGDRQQFYMPGGKVTLQLRKVHNNAFLDVKRTSLFEPRYVKSIIDQLGGVWIGGSEGSRDCPDEIVKLFLRTK